jgi:hypothetical protein
VNIENIKVSSWVKLIDIPSVGDKDKMSENCKRVWKELTDGVYSGIYQVSLKQPKDLVHKDICYIGESDFLPMRLTNLKGSAGKGNKTTHHMCGVYIREENIDINTIYVRFIPFSDKDNNRKEFEKWLQQEHKNKFDYITGYAWTEASGGHKSCRIITQASIRRIDSIESIEKVRAVLDEQLNYLRGKYDS